MSTLTLAELAPADVPAIAECIGLLADYHNRIADPRFAGVYPIAPVAEQIDKIAAAVAEGRARVLAVRAGDGGVMGFCKVSWEGRRACVDLLYVRDELRGQGWGGRLFTDQLDFLKRRDGVTLIDIMVVTNNGARAFYEKFGFAVRTDVLALRLPGNQGEDHAAHQ